MAIFIGDNIKFLRLQKGVTQEEIANLIGKSSKTVSSYENSQAEPNISIIEILSKKFGVTTDTLLFQDLKNGNYSQKTGLSIASEPSGTYGTSESRFEMTTVYVEKVCGATGGSCYFEQLKTANEEIAALKQELEKNKK